MVMNALESPSTRPYLIRAMYEWCTDHSFTPYVAVKVDGSVQVPREFVQGGEIVLNISFDATSSLQLGNEFIEFKARFGGKPRDIMVPIHRVMAIYALNSTVLGMDKLHQVPNASEASEASKSETPDSGDKPVPPSPTRPTLTRIK
jgi:stringent starvation protein B